MIHSTRTYMLPVPLPLEEGGLLERVGQAAEQYGELRDGEAVVMFHDLFSGPRLTGSSPDAFAPEGWAAGFVAGANGAVDPAQGGVLSLNLLGSPFGSTSALAVDPRTGAPYGEAFPPLTVEDLSRAAAAAVRLAGLKSVRALVGVGLGGLVALRVSTLFPDLTRNVLAFGVTHALPNGVRSFLSQVPSRLRTAGPEGAERALRKIRLEWLERQTTERLSEEERAGHERDAEGFARVFDRVSAARLCSAFAGCDLSPWVSNIKARVLLVASSSDGIAPPSRVRETHHLLAAAGVDSRPYELVATTGHEGLLAASAKIRGPLHEFIAHG